MQKKKLSIGIDLDEHLKKTIAKSIKEYKDLPVRWHNPESYHIPLVQLGWVDENVITEIIGELHTFAAEEPACDVTLEKIALQTPKGSDTPHHVRVEGVANEALRDLYCGLMDTLNIGHGDVKTFVPHIALGHIRAGAWAKLSPQPNIAKDFSVMCDVMTLTLFEQTRDNGKKLFQPVDVFVLQ